MIYLGQRGSYEVEGERCFLSRHRSGRVQVSAHQLTALLEREPRNIPATAWEALKCVLSAADQLARQPLR